MISKIKVLDNDHFANPGIRYTKTTTEADERSVAVMTEVIVTGVYGFFVCTGEFVGTTWPGVEEWDLYNDFIVGGIGDSHLTD